MKNNSKKWLSLLLAVLMIVSAVSLVACANSDTPDDNKDKPTATPSTTASPTEDPNKRIDLDIEVKNYEKAVFNAIEWTVGDQVVGQDWVPWEDINVEEYDGDTLSMAVYSRNKSVEELLNVDIVNEYASVETAASISSKIAADQQTGDGQYQLLTHRSLNLMSFIQPGYMTDMNEYADTYFHFDQPWWVQDAVASYRLGSHLYFASSEMLLRDKGATACLYYNKKLAQDNNISNLYAMVDNKQWTYEKLGEIAAVVCYDMTGDDMIDSMDDMWGMVGGVDHSYYSYIGFGYKFGTIDDDGYFEFTFGDEETISAMKTIFDEIMYSDWFYNSGNINSIQMFLADHSLFISGFIKQCNSLRNMESDYGILPLPLYNESQDSYHSLVWEHHDCVFGIPNQQPDPEMCAAVVEALSWESYYTVSPRFYETVLLDRSTRDEDSKRMLQIVLDTRTFDPGMFWDKNTSLLDGSESLLRMPSSGNKNSDVASKWAANEVAVQQNVDRVNALIDAME